MSVNANQQIRPIIECFCQILSSSGFSTVTPEIFRLAKFDRDEATVPLWRLIYEILHFNQPSLPQFDRMSKEELVSSIKSELFTRGYTYEQFLQLDSQMKHGSQQLLVCLGWLIYHLKLIESCMKKCLQTESVLDYDDTSSLYKNEKISDEKFNSKEQNQIKQAMRINSKLRFSLRRLHGLVIENANLQHQIHQCHNMSALEAHLCQHPHLLSHYLIELETEQKKLNDFLFWNQHEHVFWKWMESVLDQTTPDDEPNEIFEPLAQTDYQRLAVERQKFHTAIDTLDSALVRLQQLWISNNDRASVEQDLSLIDTQVTSLFNQLLATDPSSNIDKSHSNSSNFLHEPFRLVYTNVSDRNQFERLIKPVDFDRETQCLNNLQTNIDQQIDRQRNLLDTLSNQFQHVMIV